MCPEKRTTSGIFFLKMSEVHESNGTNSGGETLYKYLVRTVNMSRIFKTRED